LGGGPSTLVDSRVEANEGCTHGCGRSAPGTTSASAAFRTSDTNFPELFRTRRRVSGHEMSLDSGGRADSRNDGTRDCQRPDISAGVTPGWMAHEQPLRGACLISIVVCTHNPNDRNLGLVLKAIDSAVREAEAICDSEVIVVDNASEPAVTKWPGNLAISLIRAEALGLVYARQAGIRASVGSTIIFVDDDNVLDVSYVARCHHIAETEPRLGAWGGRLVGEFEREPNASLSNHFGLIGVRDVSERRVSLQGHDWNSVPYGAGLCVRREVAELWSQLVDADPLRQRLGIAGSSPLRCEDLDLAFTSHQLGLGTGLFPELSLRHLIPVSRTELAYIVKIAQGNAYSATILQAIHGLPVPAPFGRSSFRRWHAAVKTNGGTNKRVAIAEWKGSVSASWQLRRRKTC